MSVQESWGPEASGGRRRGRRLTKVVALVLVVMLALLVVLAIWLNAQIPRVEVDGLAASSTPMHVLVAGTDARDHLSSEEQRDLGVGGEGGVRADTLFIMTIRGGDVGMLALPRDLWVERCDGSTGRINVAIDAGATCLVETVQMLSGIEIQEYIEVTFDGFRDVVDAVGGVEMCLEEAISDRDAHIDLPEGCQTLEGNDALGYVRVRKIDDDLARIGRQQEFVQALTRQVATPETLFNPWRMFQLGNEAGDAVSVNQGMGPISMFRLARGARGMAGGNAVTHTVPATPMSRGGAAVLDVEETEAEQLFTRFRDGSVLDEARAGVDPAEVRVSVRNGSEISGLAGQVAELLEARGYDIGEVGNTDARDDTLVRHPPGQRAEAELVADDAPGRVVVEETSEVTHVEVLLGREAGGAS